LVTTIPLEYSIVPFERTLKRLKLWSQERERERHSGGKIFWLKRSVDSTEWIEMIPQSAN
jgi:hypothetical protein